MRWTPTVEAAIEQLALYQAHGNVVIEMRRPKSEKIIITLHAGHCLVMPLDVAFSLAATPDGACMTIAAAWINKDVVQEQKSERPRRVIRKRALVEEVPETEEQPAQKMPAAQQQQSALVLEEIFDSEDELD